MAQRMQGYISALACVWIVVGLLAGCAGNSAAQLAPIGSATNAVQQSGNHRADLFERLLTPGSVRPDFNRHVEDAKIVKPNCCALQKTLFVSDAFGGSSFTGAIYMFDYVKGTPLGQVAKPPEGFLEVQGGCADNAGNVYFANTSLSTIDEYDHGGTYVATFDDPGQYPVGCAYDKTTGNLAVSNVISTSGGAGSLSIFNGGVLENTYTVPNMSKVYFLAYEGESGVLWLDGANSSGLFQYDSFKGGTFKNVGIHGGTGIGFAGAVMWSDKTKLMNVGDQNKFSGPTFVEVDNSGNIKGYIYLTCTQSSDICDVVQATIKGPGLVGPDAILLSVNRFAYPGGGPPTLNYPAAYSQPIGSAVSANKD